MIERDWFGLYGESWTGEIVPDAFAHPAKFSRALIRKIYQHYLEQGYIRPGDKILDPFGGVALGALDAMRYGLHWTGCELEPRFVALGQKNIDEWNRRYSGWFADWGTARILQGDSRMLVDVVTEAGAVVSSPPYAGSLTDDTRPGGGIDLSKVKDPKSAKGQHFQGNTAVSYGRTPGQLGAMPEGDYSGVVSSPPYAGSVNANDAANDAAARKERKREAGIPETAWHDGGPNSQQNRPVLYGNTDGQLGAMKEGDIDAAVSSPPYAATVDGSGEGPGARYDHKYHAADNARKQSSDAGYGNTPGNLGGMVEGVVSSPPYEGSIDHAPGNKSWEGAMPGNIKNDPFYGNSNGQIGIETGETFWTAARAIVEQTHAILKPGGVAVWVTGDFVRQGQRVEFGRQWLALCEAAGFTGLEWIRAWKVEPGGEQLDIFGNGHDQSIHRVSFFRRLANKRNPEAAILNEDVWILRR